MTHGHKHRKSYQQRADLTGEHAVSDIGQLVLACLFAVHYQAYQQGYQVTVHKVDGTTEIRDFALPDGAVVLDPDVREYFPDSETVNRTLRELIHLIPQQRILGEAT